MDKKALKYIESLGLQPHPEGGYFSGIFRSEEKISSGALPSRYGSDRSFSTSIYFLLEGNQVSHFHRLKSDEIWYFHDGCPVILYIINETGELSVVRAGLNHVSGEHPQVVLPAGSWFAAELSEKDSFALIGCNVAPGFEFIDFEMGEFKILSVQFPQHKDILERLCLDSTGSH